MLKMTTVAGGAQATACALFLSTLIETGCGAQQSGGSVAGAPSQAELEISEHLTEGVAIRPNLYCSTMSPPWARRPTRSAFKSATGLHILELSGEALEIAGL